MLFCNSLLASGYFWPVSTLLHGPIVLAIPSLPETEYGSSDLKTWKTSFFRYHNFDDALDIVQTCHWLRGSLWLFGNTAYLSTKMFSMPFFSFWQMGMLGGDHSVCSTCCCLLHRRTCLYKFHILLQLGIFLVRSQCVPFRLLLLR